MSSIVDKLRRVRARHELLDQRTLDVIVEARTMGLSWRTIGTELGIGHETARRLVRHDAERRMASDDDQRS